MTASDARPPSDTGTTNVAASNITTAHMCSCGHLHLARDVHEGSTMVSLADLLRAALGSDAHTGQGSL